MDHHPRAAVFMLIMAFIGFSVTFLLVRYLPAERAHETWMPVLVSLLIVGVTYYGAQISAGMSEQFRESRKGEFRPYVTVELAKHGGRIDLLIRSVGRGAAADVRIELESPRGDKTPEKLRELALLRYTLPFLGPQRQLTIHLADHEEAIAALPDEMEFRVSYRGFYRTDIAYDERIALRTKCLIGVDEFT